MHNSKEPKHVFEVAKRRKQVAALYIMRMSYDQIVETMQKQGFNISPATISRDITFIKKTWAEDAQDDILNHIARSLKEFEQMYLDASLMCDRFRGNRKEEIPPNSKELVRWVEMKRKITNDVISLLGLDKLTAMTVMKLEEQSKTSDDKIIELKNAILESIKCKSNT